MKATPPSHPFQYTLLRRDVEDQLSMIREELEQVARDPLLGDESHLRMLDAALKGHGWTTDNALHYARVILDPIFASHSGIGGQRLKAGDWVNGIQISTLDFDLAKVLHEHEWKIMGIVENRSTIALHGAGVFDTFCGRAVSRGHLRAGPMSVIRKPDEDWAAGFVTQWLACKSESDRLRLLEHPLNFQQCILGLIRETDLDFFDILADPQLELGFYELRESLRRGQHPRLTTLDHLVETLICSNQISTAYSAERLLSMLLVLIDRFSANFWKTFIRPEAVSELAEKLKFPSWVPRMLAVDGNFLVPQQPLVAPSSFYSFAKITISARHRFRREAYRAVFATNPELEIIVPIMWPF